MAERGRGPPLAVSEGRCFVKQLFGLLLLLIFAGSMHAGDVCKKYEYAELKDMSKSALYSNYCLYTKFQQLQHEAFEDGIARSAEDRALGLDYSATTEEHRRQAEQCGDEAVRNLRVLAKKYKVEKPDCNKRK